MPDKQLGDEGIEPPTPRCKHGVIAVSPVAQSRLQLSNRLLSRKRLWLHRERTAAAAGAFGARIGDAEAAAIDFVVKIDGRVAQVHQAALIDHDRYSVGLENFVQFFIDDRVEIQLVLEAAAAAADHAHAQVNPAEHSSALT